MAIRQPVSSFLENYLLFLVLAVFGLGLVAMQFTVGIGNISWNLWQLLDPQGLRQAPLSSLWLLHAQPPMLNALLALALSLEDNVGIPAQTCVSAVIATSAAFVLWLTHKIGRQLSLSPWVMVLIFIGIIVNAHFWSGVKNFNYELILAPLALGIVANGLQFWRTGAFDALIYALILASLMTLTRTIYHPIWCGLIAVFMTGLQWIRASPAFPAANWSAPKVIVVILLIASGYLWPAKNALVFGDWVHSSWDGFNLSRGYVPLPKSLTAFLGDKELQIDLHEWNESFDPTPYAAADQVTSMTRSTGVDNWNHYIWLATRKPLLEASIDARISHPQKWASNAIHNYLMWSTASYVDPYDDSPEVRGSYGFVKSIYDGLLYNDLRDWFGTPADSADRPYARFTLMALVYIPLFLVIGTVLGIRSTRQGCDLGPGLLTLVALYSWPMMISMLTDGQESTRFRIAVEPLFWLGWGVVAAHLPLFSQGRLASRVVGMPQDLAAASLEGRHQQR